MAEQAHALRRHGAAHPLVVLLPKDLPAGVEQPLLDDAAAHGTGAHGSFTVSVERVDRLFYAPGWTTAGCRYWWLNAAGHYAELEQSLNKLWAFSLTRFAMVVYLDADGNPMLTTPTPDSPPVWSNTTPATETLAVAADGLTAVATSVAVGTDSISVTDIVGGQTFSASIIVNVGAKPQVLTSIQIAATVV